MKNNMFSGWKDVFLFTLKQGFSNRYRVTTIVIALIFLCSGLAINGFMALSQKKDDNISPIEKVYVIDESGIGDIDWSDSEQLNKEQFPNVVFENTSQTVSELGTKLNSAEKTGVILKLGREDDKYLINVLIPYESEVSTDDGENLGKAVKEIVHIGMINNSNIDSDKLAYVVSGIDSEFRTAGEDAKSDNLVILTTVFPMIFMFVIYFMVIIYGQGMGQIVCVEKSSKLMETLLVMTRPYGLIFGKIIATASSAILQVFIWIAAMVAGIAIGDGFARNLVYAQYENRIFELLSEVSTGGTTDAFTIEAAILTFIALCLAFLFYCMLAGAISSFAGKAEELGTVMVFYNFFLAMGFLCAYVLPTMVGKEWIKNVIRIVPFSAAFLLPGEILVGTIKLQAGAAYLVVLFVWIILVAIFAGKIYRDQVFYNGKGLLERIPWVKKRVQVESDEQWQILHDEAGRPLEKSQKVGYFFVAISPLAIFIVIQIVASLVLTNVMTRSGLKGIDLSGWEVKDFVDFYHGIEKILNPLTVMVSHLLIITIFGLWMYAIRKGIDSKNIFHVKSLLGKRLGILVGICLINGLGLCALANGTLVIESVLIPSIVEDYLEMASSAGMGTSPFAIFAAVCLAPIGEELLCRGVCLHFGKKAFTSFWWANILQAVIFGVLHMNWVQGIYAFAIGIVLGVLVERYESLIPAMFVHFIVNFSASTWAPKVFGNIAVNLTTGILLVAIPAVIAVVSLYLTRISHQEA